MDLNANSATDQGIQSLYSVWLSRHRTINFTEYLVSYLPTGDHAALRRILWEIYRDLI